MAKFTRRSLLRNSFGLVAAGTLSRPYIAKAAAKTATVWWVQAAEDIKSDRQAGLKGGLRYRLAVRLALLSRLVQLDLDSIVVTGAC